MLPTSAGHDPARGLRSYTSVGHPIDLALCVGVHRLGETETTSQSR
jgi:hypothetical protein